MSEEKMEHSPLAIAAFERAFCNWVNASADPWEISKWNDECWKLREKLCYASDDLLAYAKSNQAAIKELVEALDDIANGTSHSDTCSYELTPETSVCDCHRAIAARAIAKHKAGA